MLNNVQSASVIRNTLSLLTGLFIALGSLDKCCMASQCYDMKFEIEMSSPLLEQDPGVSGRLLHHLLQPSAAGGLVC